MSARNQQSELERIIEALIFSFFIYIAYIFAFGPALPLEWSSTAMSGATAQVGVVTHRWRILAISVLAIAFGFIWGFVKGHDLLLKFLRRCKLTERTSRESVWNDVFLSLTGWVQVGLADGRTAMGWLARYSDTGDERTLFLEKASWISDEGAVIPIEGPGLLITEKAEIRFVMFLTTPERIGETQ